MSQTDVMGLSTAFAKAGQDGGQAANVFARVMSDVANASQSGSPSLAKYANLVGLTVSQFKELGGTDQFLKIFSAIYGALKSGGSLYLYTPNAEYFMERLREWGVVRQIEGHVAVRTADSQRALLAQCGFASVRVRYLAHYLYPASALHGLGTLPLIGRYFRARLFLTIRKGTLLENTTTE